ncbi:MAG: four helix bundle protein [Patescibacteria group bacterium]|jgi:four helix bundle protein
MTNQIQNSNGEKIYDLEVRTTLFGTQIISLCNSIRKTIITVPLISQIIRSATSVGANYMEANGADSKKDFHAKIGICKKEAKETIHWLRMIEFADETQRALITRLLQEAKELSLIFGAINKK